MNQSQFSRYCNGRGSVGPSVVSKILPAFPEESQSALVRGYLLDQLSSEALRHVEIISRTGIVSEAESDGLDQLPADVKQALRFIGSRCSERPVKDLILDLARILRGEK